MYRKINPCNVAQLLLQELATKYGPSNDDEISAAELEFKDQLINIFDECMASQEFTFSEEITLFKDKDSCNDAFIDMQSDIFIESEHDVDVKTMEAVVAFWEGTHTRKRKFATVKHRFRFLVDEKQLYRFKKYIADGGNRKLKLKDIGQDTMAKFNAARALNLPVHDSDIRKWALSKARALNCVYFKASHSWINTFKSANGICSRKITEFVSKNYKDQSTEIHSRANEFVTTVKAAISNLQISNVFNADQSGFNYELHSLRTLSAKREKATLSCIKSTLATTHSYTIQVMISMDGKLLAPLFLCLQEPGGTFGPIVRQKLFTATNISTHCSTSGKMTKELVRSWFATCLKPFLKDDNCVLLLDSWPGQTDETVCQHPSLQLLIIPPKCTSLIQPLDVYFFRQWKLFAKKLYNAVQLSQSDVDLHARNNIIKLQSLIHNQLSSPRFYKMIQYAWSISGYSDNNVETFLNVNQVCFTFSDIICDKCDGNTFIKCAWCVKHLCITHFFTEYHFCVDEQ